MRRNFRLPEHDEEFLVAMGRPWETIVEQGNSHGTRWLLVRDYQLPKGYEQSAVEVALNIVPTYPDAQLDMVWFHPHVGRADGRGLGGVGGGYKIDGRDWQRWLAS